MGKEKQRAEMEPTSKPSTWSDQGLVDGYVFYKKQLLQARDTLKHIKTAMKQREKIESCHTSAEMCTKLNIPQCTLRVKTYTTAKSHNLASTQFQLQNFLNSSVKRGELQKIKWNEESVKIISFDISKHLWDTRDKNENFVVRTVRTGVKTSGRKEDVPSRPAAPVAL